MRCDGRHPGHLMNKTGHRTGRHRKPGRNEDCDLQAPGAWHSRKSIFLMLRSGGCFPSRKMSQEDINRLQLVQCQSPSPQPTISLASRFLKGCVPARDCPARQCTPVHAPPNLLPSPRQRTAFSSFPPKRKIFASPATKLPRTSVMASLSGSH